MRDIVEQAAELQALLEKQGWRFCFIGGIAIQRWSEPRLTKDMDITLLTGFGNEEPFIDFLLQHFESRISDARAFALQNRILLLKTAEGTGIDVALGGLPFEEEAVRRSKLLEYAPGISLRTCSAEDLLVMKAFASRLTTTASPAAGVTLSAIAPLSAWMSKGEPGPASCWMWITGTFSARARASSRAHSSSAGSTPSSCNGPLR